MRTFAMLSITLFGCTPSDSFEPVEEVGRGPDVSPPGGGVLPPVTTGPALVTVQVTRDGAPAVGIDVVFHDAGGAVLAHHATTAQGSAEEVLDAEGMVSVVHEDGSIRRLTTVSAVRPGETVVVALGEPQADPSVGSVRVSLPGSASGASRYTIDLGCAAISTTNASAPRTLDVKESCFFDADPTVHVFATAWNSAGSAVAWSLAEVTLTSGTPSVDLPAWSTVWRGISMSLGAAPSGARFASATGEWTIGDGGFDAADQPVASLSAGQGAVLETRVPSVAAEGFVGRVSIAHGTDAGLTGFTDRIERMGEVPTSMTLGMTTDFLPAVTASSLDASDPARPSVGWIAAGSLEAADLGRVEITWRDGGGDRVWEIIVPSSASAPVRAPELPEALSGYRPESDATFAVPQVYFHAADWVDGYAAVKASGFSPELPPGPHVISTSLALNP